MRAEFVQHEAVRLVDVTDLSQVADAHVDGCHVRVALRVTSEERAHLDLERVRQELMSRGALRVLMSTRVVRASASAPVADALSANEKSAEALRAWLRASGEDPDVIAAALELLDVVVRVASR